MLDENCHPHYHDDNDDNDNDDDIDNVGTCWVTPCCRMSLRTGWHWLARMYWQLPASPAGVVHWDPRRRVPAFFLLVCSV